MWVPMVAIVSNLSSLIRPRGNLLVSFSIFTFSLIPNSRMMVNIFNGVLLVNILRFRITTLVRQKFLLSALQKASEALDYPGAVYLSNKFYLSRLLSCK